MGGRRRELIAEIWHAAEVLNHCHCLPATDGNLSARLSSTHVLLTRSGTEKRALAEHDFVEVELTEENPDGASSEWLMHRAIYSARTEVQCVLHVHAPYLNCFAVTHQCPNVALLAEAAIMIPKMTLVPFALPGTPELGNAVISASRTAPIYILANHGVVAVGATVREALHRLERAEFLARVEVQSRALGNARPLSDESIQNMIDVYKNRAASVRSG